MPNDEGWLERRVQSAKEEVESWSAWKKEAVRKEVNRNTSLSSGDSESRRPQSELGSSRMQGRVKDR